MQNSDYYRLEISCDKHKRKFVILETLSVSLKILSLLSLIVFFRYFYIAISLWVVSVILGFFKRNLIYKYVYTVKDGMLTVEKEYGYEKKILMEKVILKEATLKIGQAPRKYYQESKEIPLAVKYADREFSIDVDEYFYAISEFYNKNGDNYDIFG